MDLNNQIFRNKNKKKNCTIQILMDASIDNKLLLIFIEEFDSTKLSNFFLCVTIERNST
ncbi:hypothetical protein HMPREF9019_0640 [Hoylesella timonensis CRIS 5C-B1]|uniref:Uncharacterized protein n=1 Tax=Hoylesella timonensis CRIS 5C-B1 TaxID=679189 RepID=D1VX75_9BACT|nr:hypothetical protein HMPREF9019_0640 [Hoylesella timonensis CRIS 5C-B1]